MVADGNAAITAVIALPQGSSCQSRTSDGNAVLSFREGTIAECHGVRTECPVVIDVGPLSIGIFFQIIAGRLNIVRTYGKILARQSVFDHLIADCGRNIIKVLNPIRNRPGNGIDPTCHAGNFIAVHNLGKQISGNLGFDFIFFLLRQRLYICHAARQKRRHDKSGKQAVFDAGFILPVSFCQLGSDDPAVFRLAPNQLINFIHRAS